MVHLPVDGDAVEAGADKQQRLQESQEVVGVASDQLRLLDPLLLVVGNGAEGLEDVGESSAEDPDD